MKITSMNVNGVRASTDKGLLDFLSQSAPDIIGLQETKVNAVFPKVVMPGYSAEWCFADRRGYSGTLCLFRNKPLTVTRGLGKPELDGEGRLVTLEYPGFFFVTVYVPNSKGGLGRWYYRLDWDAAFAEYLVSLQAKKPVIAAGDFNVAHDFADVNPENLRNGEMPHGFLTEERDGFNALLETGMADVFRELHPDTVGAYTWWSNRLNRRKENRGWRLDYFLVSRCLLDKVKACTIRSDVAIADHAPIELVIAI